MTTVLDAHALIAYLEKEHGYEKVRDAFSRANTSRNNLLISVVNWGEVYYSTFRSAGEEGAESIVKILEGFPLDIVNADKELTKQAGQYKASRKMSYADCFAAALAKQRKAELITGDKEFKSVEDEIKILWLR